jgi:hypothetical protein
MKLLKNKKGLLAREWIIGLIIFSVICGIFGLVVSDMASSDNGYNVANMSDSNFDAAYNQVSNTSGIAGQMGNATVSKEGLSTFGSVELFFGSTISVIQLTFGSLSMVNNVFTNIFHSFGIPSVLANIIFPAIISIITVILVFIVVSSLTKTKM